MMESREIAGDLVQLMIEFVLENPNAPGVVDPMTAMLRGGAGLINPSSASQLMPLGTATVVPWIELLAKMGYVGTVAPIATGWLCFQPSVKFYEIAKMGNDASVKRQILDAMFPSPVPTPNPASVAVDTLRAELADLNVGFDPELLDVVLRELRDVCASDCRHAAIALCGKLLELGLGGLLRRWGREFGERATLDDLIGQVRSCSSQQAPPSQNRAEAANLMELGIAGHADLIRTVRNGAVHARAWAPDVRGVELPSREQADGVVLLVVDILRRCSALLRADSR